MSSKLEIGDELEHASKAFSIVPAGVQWKPIKKGLIHQTFRSVPNDPNQKDSYILQIINTSVFRQPEKVMNNIVTVAHHLEHEDYPKIILKPLSTSDGKNLFRGTEHCWRCYPFISNTKTINTASSADVAYEIANTFGEYLYYLSNLDTDQLSVTLPGFHDTQQRYAQLKNSFNNATHHRKSSAIKTLRQLENLNHLLGYFPAISLLTRVTHGDTKINNILFDEASQSPVCIVDLDTLMPGMISYDLGDMVRTIGASVSEEHKEITEVEVKKDYLEALFDGFLTSLKGAISREERESLQMGCALLIFEQSIRFLNDYLQNDNYYPVNEDQENLIRSQNQLALLRNYLDRTGVK